VNTIHLHHGRPKGGLASLRYHMRAICEVCVIDPETYNHLGVRTVCECEATDSASEGGGAYDSIPNQAMQQRQELERPAVALAT
jgi:hypothetical protein